jgi:hypothetical protein
MPYGGPQYAGDIYAGRVVGSVAASVNAQAGTANVTVAAYNAAASINTNAGTSTVAAAAYAATASVNVHASVGAVTVAAYNPAAHVNAAAGHASVSATAYNPSIKTSASVFPGTANVTATAYNIATKPIPTPPVITTAINDGAGIVVRPKKKDEPPEPEYKPKLGPIPLRAQYDALLQMGEISEEEWIGILLIHGLDPVPLVST